MTTFFAPSERATQEDLFADVEEVQGLPLIQELTGLLPHPFVILNLHRQIIFCNPTLVSLLGITGPESIYGLRPGEALNCIHADKAEGGCGTSQFCRYCGAVNAILISQKDTQGQIQQECRLTVGEENQSFDFNVRASTLSLMDRHFTLVILQDIGTEKRRNIMERIFFHDILNTAGGIQGLIELMREATPEELDEFLVMAEASTETLVEEINAQRDLFSAERGDLSTDTFQVNALDLVSQVAAMYRAHPVAEDKRIAVHPDTSTSDFLSDPRLLTRVLGNMVKNALEAEGPGSVVTLGADLLETEMEFWVANPSVMPEEVRLQVFQRSFSTKGSGRGLGTYSIRLLGENYLKGKVAFESREPHGTRFSIRVALGI